MLLIIIQQLGTTRCIVTSLRPAKEHWSRRFYQAVPRIAARQPATIWCVATLWCKFHARKPPWPTCPNCLESQIPSAAASAKQPQKA